MRNNTKLKRVLVVIHGGTGDLAMRKLYLALYQLFERYGENIHIDIWGTGKQNGAAGPLTDDEFRELIFKRHPGKYSTMLWGLFAPRIRYFHGRCTDTGDFRSFADQLCAYRKQYPEAGVLVFLSLHPDHFGPTVENYQTFDLVPKTNREPETGWTRFLIEKPFALNVAQGERLYNALKRLLPEESFFAFDHYWFKPMIHGILAHRFGNTITEPRHNSKFVDSIRIRALETVGVEGRGAYVGATMDMMLSHLLLVFALTRIGQPDEVQTIENLHQRLIGSIAELSRPGVITGLQLGRYRAGQTKMVVDGEHKDVTVQGFLEEGGALSTETAARLTIRPPGTRWNGQVEWEIVTGKRTAPLKVIDYLTRFKLPPHNLFERGIYAVRNGPNAIQRNDVLYTIEAERPKNGSGKWALERFCGTKLRKMMANVDVPFGLRAYEEVSTQTLGSSDGYREAFEELLIPDRLVIRKALALQGDRQVGDDEIGEFVSTQSICLMPVAFQLLALKALEPLLHQARNTPSCWTEYDAFTCPWVQ